MIGVEIYKERREHWKRDRDKKKKKRERRALREESE